MAQTNKSVFFTALNPSLFCSKRSVSQQHDVHPDAGAGTSVAFSSSCCQVSPCPRRQEPPLAISQRRTILQGQPSRADVKAAALWRLDKRPSASVSCLSAASALVHERIKDVLWCQSSSVRGYKQEKCFIIKKKKKKHFQHLAASRVRLGRRLSPVLDLNLSDSTLV